MYKDCLFYILALVSTFVGVVFLATILAFHIADQTWRLDSKKSIGFRVIVVALFVVTLISTILAWNFRSNGINDELTMIAETIPNRKIVSVDVELTRSQYRDEQTVDVNRITYIDESNEEATIQLFFTKAWILPSNDDSYHIAISDDEKLTIYKPTVMISE